MALQKKHYRSMDPKTGRHQERGGGMTTRKNSPHRYATRDVEKVESPTWLAARAVKKLPITKKRFAKLMSIPV